jgi:hypothetical protein
MSIKLSTVIMSHLNDSLLEREINPENADLRIEFIRQLAFEKLNNITIDANELDEILERTRTRLNQSKR